MNKCFFNKSIMLIILLINMIDISAQTHQLTGKTQDSLKNPIPNTNIIATPLAEDANITFAISSLNGEYNLKLENNITYKIDITHLGFSKITDTVKLTQDQTKNYTLEESTETLLNRKSRQKTIIFETIKTILNIF